jgi:hypothetical protein
LFHDAQENAQRQRLDRGIVLQVVAQPLRNRQHPLADRQLRKNVVGQMGCGFDHSPSVASGTDAAALVRPGDEKIVTTLGASSAGKTMRYGTVDKSQTFHEEHLASKTHGSHATSIAVRTDQ